MKEDSESGMTLLEISAAVMIVSIIIFSLTIMYTYNTKTLLIFSQDQSFTSSSYNLKQLMDKDFSTADFSINSVSNSDLSIVSNGSTIHYYISGNNLMRSVNGTTPDIIMYNIASVKFTQSVTLANVIYLYVTSNGSNSTANLEIRSIYSVWIK